jgi:hypothetical protein
MPGIWGGAKSCCEQPFPKVVTYEPSKQRWGSSVSVRSARRVIQEREIAHKGGTGQRKRGLRAAETEIANGRLSIWNPQEPVYSARRSSFERCVVKTDDVTICMSEKSRCDEKEDSIEEHP